MDRYRNIKKRGFVMTGGGAKGLYEAGVIHAFHITGMSFDVITGSSIGAMNTIYFAEYLLHKRDLSHKAPGTPEDTIDAMDDMVRAYLHAWLTLPEVKIIDDTEQGPLGQLKDDLLKFNVSLPQLTRLLWWASDPGRDIKSSATTWTALVSLGKELVERLSDGGIGEGVNHLRRIYREHRDTPIQEIARTYLKRFKMEEALVPEEDDQKLRDVFTQKIVPLRREHLGGHTPVVSASDGQKIGLIEAQRTLREYADAGIDVRVTRANYRTGRLEISTYLSTEDFVRYMESQKSRLKTTDPEMLTLGSFRIQLPGDPVAINAALASGRFPGVFSPYPIHKIYPKENEDNRLLYAMLSNWLNDPDVEARLSQAYQALYRHDPEKLRKWESLFTDWRKSDRMREFFPRLGDRYVDGGAIDNTPTNSAVDAIREWAQREGKSKRDLVLDLYVVLLHPEPKVDPVDVKNPSLYEVVNRTLEIQGAAKLSSDAGVVGTINKFGQRGEDLGETMMALLESTQETLTDEQRASYEEVLREKIRQRGLEKELDLGEENPLEQIKEWGDRRIRDSLPLHVETVKIHPEEMPLSTLQFTERLGYRKDNAIKMITMGCYNTLWTLRSHLESRDANLDEVDQRALALTRKWMGDVPWPDEAEEQQELQKNWRCRRTSCVFHAQHCQRGNA